MDGHDDSDDVERQTTTHNRLGYVQTTDVIYYLCVNHGFCVMTNKPRVSAFARTTSTKLPVNGEIPIIMAFHEIVRGERNHRKIAKKY